MKNSTHKLSFLLFLSILSFSCSSEKEIAKTLPQLSTNSATNITLTSASSGGNITADGGAEVTARGLVWNTVTQPTVSLATKTTDGSGIGDFPSAITNLSPSTNYYARAYATNSVGTGYGNEITFTTGAIVLPTLTTIAVTGVTSNSAISGGTITNDGGSTVTARGVVWSTTQNPTIALTTKTNDVINTGTYTSNLTNLAPNTTYYLRAYATNSVGTNYGNEISFATPKLTVTDADGNVYQTIQIGTQLWMSENLKSTKFCNGDPIPFSNSTIFWNDDEKTTPAYNIYFFRGIKNYTYNGNTAIDSRNPCPCGWRVPNNNDWAILSNFLGNDWINTQYGGYSRTTGQKLKSIGNIEDGTGLWFKSNYPGTNASGFNAIPFGAYISESDINGILSFRIQGGGSEVLLLSSNTSMMDTYLMVHFISLSNLDNYFSTSYTYRNRNGSIRCVKN